MSKFTCSECGKSYNYNKNLRHHIRKIHPHKEQELFSAGRDTYCCRVCEKFYFKTSKLRQHEYKSHGIKNCTKVSSCQCPLCDFRCLGRTELRRHFQGAHEIDLEFEDVEFSSVSDFHVWKEELERDTNAKFVKVSGIKRRSNYNIAYYYCHRSGNYICKGTGRRNLKTQGSNKINRCCPASIRLSTFNDSTCHVHFVKTHVGHRNSPQHLCFTSAQRDMLAAKIAANIPFDTILAEVRASTGDSKLQKFENLTKKDLYNIESCYELSAGTRRTSSDAESQKSLRKSLRIIHNRHRAGLLLKKESVTPDDNGWFVCAVPPSEANYFVQLNDSNCGCNVVCTECRACIHKYSCTCEDNSEKGNMCKHIHLVCHLCTQGVQGFGVLDETSEFSSCALVSNGEEGHIFVDPENEVCLLETEIVLEGIEDGMVNVESEVEDFHLEKEAIKKSFAKFIDSLSTLRELTTIRTFLASLKEVVTVENKNLTESDFISENVLETQGSGS